MLIEFIRFSNSIEEPEPIKSEMKIGSRKGSVDSNSELISESQITGSDSPSYFSPTLDFADDKSLNSNQSFSRRTRKAWKRHWKKMIIFLPLVSSLPSLFLVYDHQAHLGWRYVHADPFACYAPDPLVRRIKAIILLCHLIPTSIIGIICVVMYFILRQQTITGFYQKIHYGLLIRLAALSVLSGIGAALEFSINFIRFNRSISLHIPSIYLIFFPLVSAAIFVDKNILNEWKSWFQSSIDYFSR